MNFVEQLFGFSPDGGSGVFEFLLVAVPIIALSIIHWTRSARSKRKA
jgi:hypothetical protein